MEKISGFEQIDLGKTPWSIDLEPCLKRWNDAPWLDRALRGRPLPCIGSTNRAMEAKLTLLEMRGKRQIDLDT